MCDLLTSITATIATAAQSLNEYATLILVIITVIYAYSTHKMAKAMERQITADIHVSDLVVGTQFAEEWFQKMLKKRPQNLESSYFRFKLAFDVFNKATGNGSIEKPTLIINFPGTDKEWQVIPTTKSIKSRPVPNTSNTTEIETIDLGGTIFLRGGDSKKVELEYNLYDPDNDFLTCVKEKSKSAKYFIEFRDNLGKKHRARVSKITGEDDAYRP